MRKHRGAAIIIGIIICLLIPGLATGQQGGAQLEIIGVDATDFPTIVFQLEAIDEQFNTIGDMQGLALFEDGRAITEFEAQPVDVGVDLFIVIDANSTINDRDEAGGASRREKVRDSIIRYAERFMDPTQLDRVTIIVPEGAGGRFLDRPSMTFPNEVINAINFYQPDELDDVNLDRLLFMALDEAARSVEEGRHQAIVLFSDAANLADRPDSAAFLTRAQEQDVAVYPVILGNRADTHEIEQATMLSEPTGGAYIHMPEPADADGLYDALQRRGTLTEITYRSALDSSGSHMLSAELSGGRGEATVDLMVEPPLVQMAVDNSRPIVRVATDSETPLELMEPSVQPLVAQIEWPDDHPRALVSAALLVDGRELPLDGSVLSNDGILTFDWNIAPYDSGVFNLQVQVVDELGLTGASSPLPLTIEIQRPMDAAPPAPTATPEPAVAPTSAPVEPDQNQLPDDLVIAGAVAILVIALLVILIVAVLIWRSRRQPAPSPAEQQAPPAVQPAPPAQPASPPVHPVVQAAPQVAPPAMEQADPGVTQIDLPDFVAAAGAGAYLEVLENAPEHPGFIPISGNNVTLGRDSRRVSVLFKDMSVSRLHARILESHGTYRIYDEGSASGTYVNYERVSLAPRTLEDKDQIHLGRVYLRFHLASSLPSPAGPDADETNTQVFGAM